IEALAPASDLGIQRCEALQSGDRYTIGNAQLIFGVAHIVNVSTLLEHFGQDAEILLVAAAQINAAAPGRRHHIGSELSQSGKVGTQRLLALVAVTHLLETGAQI